MMLRVCLDDWVGCAEGDRQARAGVVWAGKWDNRPEPVSQVVWTQGWWVGRKEAKRGVENPSSAC
jgi:hypothetical protein